MGGTHPNNEGCFIPPRKGYSVSNLKYVNNPHERHGSIHSFSSDKNTYKCPKCPKCILIRVLLGRKQDIVDEVDEDDVWDPEF